MVNVLSTKVLRPESLALLEGKAVLMGMESFIQLDYHQNIKLPKHKGPVQAIFTSAHSVNAIAPILKDLAEIERIFCIEGQTRKAVEELFPHVSEIFSAPYAAELLVLMDSKLSGSPIWFFKGNKALPTIPNGLKKLKRSFEAIEVYKNSSCPKKIEHNFDAILFLSPSAIESFLLDNFITDNTITFAVGTTTAKALEGHAKHIIIAEKPSEASMLSTLFKHFNI